MLFKPKFLLIFIVLIFPVLLLVTGLNSRRTVRLAGSTAFQPFAEKLADLYMDFHPEVVVDVQGGGSALGIMAASQGIVDMGMADMVSLPPVTASLEKIIVAYDGIAVIVNPANNLRQLSTAEIRKIFSGEVSNWQEAGSSLKGAIRIISREEGSGTRKSFDQLVLGAGKLSPGAMYQDSNGTIRETVKNDPNAIGYISIGFVDHTVIPLSVDGVEANNVNVKSGKYAITRPIYLLLKSPVLNSARGFADFLLSKQAQEQIARDGLIPVI